MVVIPRERESHICRRHIYTVRRRRGAVLLLLLLASVAECVATPVAHPSSAPSASTALVGPSASARAARAAVVTDGEARARRAPQTQPAAASFPATRNPVRPPTPPARGHGGGEIVFPDSRYRPRISGRRPSCAREGSTFCEEGVEGYPMVHLSAVLENSVGIRELFGNDTLPEPIGDRIGGDTTICRSQEKIIFPKMGQNVDGEWVFIVNLDSNYQQGIRVELCDNTDKPCLFANAFPAGAGGICKQKYIFRRLVAVGDAGEPQSDSFRLPSCCACFIDNAVASRAMFGVNPPQTSRRRRRRHHTAR